MHVTTLGVHESVDAVFPAARLVDTLSAAPGEVAIRAVDDDDIADCDAVVTLEHREAYRDLAWVHSIQAGIDRENLEHIEAGDALRNRIV